jgi:hypothetical protein
MSVEEKLSGSDNGFFPFRGYAFGIFMFQA